MVFWTVKNTSITLFQIIKIFEISHNIRYNIAQSQRRTLTLSEHIIEQVLDPILLNKQTMHVVKMC